MHGRALHPSDRESQKPGGGTRGNPTIEDLPDCGRNWPDYLLERSVRLANPSQSLQALTVGLIGIATFQDGGRRSLAQATHPSCFTRGGHGLWDSIKPDVVEFGGDYVWDGANPGVLHLPPQVCLSLVLSTLNGGPAVGEDVVGIFRCRSGFPYSRTARSPFAG